MKLKELRLSRKLSQEDVSKFVGCSQSQYSKYELGKSLPDANTLINLADFYDCSVDYLLGRPFNSVGYIPDEKKTMIKNLLELDDSNTKTINDNIDFLLEKQNKK